MYDKSNSVPTFHVKSFQISLLNIRAMTEKRVHSVSVSGIQLPI